LLCDQEVTAGLIMHILNLSFYTVYRHLLVRCQMFIFHVSVSASEIGHICVM